MATTKGTTIKGTTSKATTTRKRAASRTTTGTTTSKPRAATSKKLDDSLVARTGRTIKERPYTSAAIATGAATVVAAAAAGAFLMARRDKSPKEPGDGLSSKVKGGIASATATVKELSQRGAEYLKGDDADASSETRTQQEIAEEALTLKETGASSSPLDSLSTTEIKTGAVSY